MTAWIAASTVQATPIGAKASRITETIPNKVQPASWPAAAYKPGHLAFLDGWRGLAIAFVLAAHFLPGPVIKTGAFGVELFFVLSGRLMADTLFVQKVPLPRFYQRRISRILPALVVLCLTIWALTPLIPAFNVKGRDVFRALTFTMNYALAATDYPVGDAPQKTVIDQVWSLCIEEHAYIVLSLVALAARRWRWPPVPILTALTAAAMLNGLYRTLIGQGYFEVWWRTDARIGSVLASVIFYLWLRPWYAKQDGLLWKVLPLVAGALGMASHAHLCPVVLEYTAGTLLLAFSVCTIDFSWKFLTDVLSFRALTLVGIWSYSLYLWQQPVAYLAPPGGHPGLIFMALAFIPSLMSFYLIENPARRAINNALSGRARAPKAQLQTEPGQ